VKQTPTTLDFLPFSSRSTNYLKRVICFRDGALRLVLEEGGESPLDSTVKVVNLYSPFVSGDHYIFSLTDSNGNTRIVGDSGQGLEKLVDLKTEVPGGGGTFQSFENAMFDGNLVIFVAITAE
jgi:hypothetical protein